MMGKVAQNSCTAPPGDLGSSQGLAESHSAGSTWISLQMARHGSISESEAARHGVGNTP